RQQIKSLSIGAFERDVRAAAEQGTGGDGLGLHAVRPKYAEETARRRSATWRPIAVCRVRKLVIPALNGDGVDVRYDQCCCLRGVKKNVGDGMSRRTPQATAEGGHINEPLGFLQSIRGRPCARTRTAPIVPA